MPQFLSGICRHYGISQKTALWDQTSADGSISVLGGVVSCHVLQVGDISHLLFYVILM
jgi:hypothetical protein